MSLKAFHLVFITAACLLAVGFGIWLLKTYLAEGGVSNLVFSLVSFLAAAGLVVYECFFLKKTKNLSYL